MDNCRHKRYIENTCYHIYNRGVAKQRIFFARNDYQAYLNFIDEYLTPKNELIERINKANLSRFEIEKKLNSIIRLKNFSNNIFISGFCLMPNHVHLIVHQKSAKDISIFMKSLHTRFSKHLNTKRQRVGHLFQDRFKAIPVQNNDYFAWVSRYIHRNPDELGHNYRRYLWSSYRYFARGGAPNWLHTQPTLEAFKKSKYFRGQDGYLGFVNDDSL